MQLEKEKIYKYCVTPLMFFQTSKTVYKPTNI